MLSMQCNAMQCIMMAQIMVSTRLPQYRIICESEREEEVHDDRGNTLSVGEGKRGSTAILSSLDLKLTITNILIY